MKLGNLNIIIFCIVLILNISTNTLAEDKIESVPLINLEELSPTFEEDKDELDKIEDKNTNIDNNKSITDTTKDEKNDVVYINLKALDKITAKTSSF